MMEGSVQIMTDPGGPKHCSKEDEKKERPVRFFVLKERPIGFFI
jgi:hypothetical protein